MHADNARVRSRSSTQGTWSGPNTSNLQSPALNNAGPYHNNGNISQHMTALHMQAAQSHPPMHFDPASYNRFAVQQHTHAPSGSAPFFHSGPVQYDREPYAHPQPYIMQNGDDMASAVGTRPEYPPPHIPVQMYQLQPYQGGQSVTGVYPIDVAVDAASRYASVSTTQDQNWSYQTASGEYQVNSGVDSATRSDRAISNPATYSSQSTYSNSEQNQFRNGYSGPRRNSTVSMGSRKVTGRGKARLYDGRYREEGQDFRTSRSQSFNNQSKNMSAGFFSKQRYAPNDVTENASGYYQSAAGPVNEEVDPDFVITRHSIGANRGDVKGLWITNFGTKESHLTEEQLQEYFEACAPVSYVKIVNNDEKSTTPYAFVK
jgi:hypothetical protein